MGAEAVTGGARNMSISWTLHAQHPINCDLSDGDTLRFFLAGRSSIWVNSGKPFAKHSTRKVRISIGILSLAALSVLAGCAKTQKAGPEPVPVVEIVAMQHVQPSWTYSGEIRPDTMQANVRPGRSSKSCRRR
jgi:hypothetical protein